MLIVYNIAGFLLRSCI